MTFNILISFFTQCHLCSIFLSCPYWILATCIAFSNLVINAILYVMSVKFNKYILHEGSLFLQPTFQKLCLWNHWLERMRIFYSLFMVWYWTQIRSCGIFTFFHEFISQIHFFSPISQITGTEIQNMIDVQKVGSISAARGNQ